MDRPALNLDSVVVDASFIINAYQLSLIDKLCEVFDEILFSPTVWKECQRLWKELGQLRCVKQVILSAAENEKAKELHTNFCESYPGFHLGEIEALVVAKTRNCPIVLSDNFAPWFLRKMYPEFERIQIYRGFYFVDKLLEAKVIPTEVLKRLHGIYSQKIIRQLEQKSKEQIE